MSGVYIAEFEKPSECGHHIDKYVPVMTCPFAKKNGACRLLRSGVHKRDGKRLSFREQYDRCPLAEVPDNQWIPVTERLPLLHTPVLVTDGIEVDISWMYGVPPRWIKNYTAIDEDKLTHWMPLPQTPKEE